MDRVVYDETYKIAIVGNQINQYYPSNNRYYGVYNPDPALL